MFKGFEVSVGAVDSFIGATDTLVIMNIFIVGFQWGFRGTCLLGPFLLVLCRFVLQGQPCLQIR